MIAVIETFISGLSKQEKKFLYVALCFIGLALIDSLMVRPITAESRKISEQIESQLRMTKKNIRILEYKDRIYKEDAMYEKNYYVRETLTEEELIANFLSEVETLAKTSGIAMININPVAVQEKRGYLQFSLQIECSGGMKKFVNFFHSIAKSEKPIRLGSFDFAVKKREKYEMKCTLIIFKTIIAKSGITLNTSGKSSDVEITDALKK